MNSLYLMKYNLCRCDHKGFLTSSLANVRRPYVQVGGNVLEPSLMIFPYTDILFRFVMVVVKLKFDSKLNSIYNLSSSILHKIQGIL